MFSRRRIIEAESQARRHALPKLHTVPALLEGKDFIGAFEMGAARYGITYTPTKASTDGNRLVFEGRIQVTGGRGRARRVERVGARLAATQGGLGDAPQHPRATDGQPAPASLPRDERPLPEVEATGRLSYVGVIYLHLDPISGRQVGVPADLGRVQLDVRLVPGDETGREVHWLIGGLVASINGVEGSNPDSGALLSELNAVLKG